MPLDLDLTRLATSALLIWSIAVACVSLEAVRRYGMRMRRARKQSLNRLCGHAQSSDRPEVLLLRPCAGAEPELLRTLRSACGLYTGGFKLCCVFGLESESDAALGPAQMACEELKAHGIRAEVRITHASAPNRKAAQLESMLQSQSPFKGVIVVADSDVDLWGVDLDAFISPLFGPDAAKAVWAPPVEKSRSNTLGDKASAAFLGASLHSFPLLGGLDRGGLVGKLFALQARSLEEIGGFGSLSQILGEDMELARRLKAKKGRIALAPFPALSLAQGRSFSQAAQRFARWMMMIRTQRPLLLLSYPALFFATPLLVLLSLFALPYAPAMALGSLLLALLSRLLVAFTATLAQGLKPSLFRLLQDVLLSDALLMAAFFHALGSRRVVWRKHTLSVGANGALSRRATL